MLYSISIHVINEEVCKYIAQVLHASSKFSKSNVQVFC